MRSNRTQSEPGVFSLDILAAIGGISSALLFIPLYFRVTHLFILGIPVMAAIASVLYLLSRRAETERRIAPLPSWLARILPSLGLFGMAVMVLLSVVEGSRSLVYYNVAIVVSVLIFYQIVFARDRDFSVRIVLGQVIVFAFVLRYTALFTTTGFVGIDIWTHVPNWTAGIIETASIAPLEGGKYYAAPWFHLLVAGTALLGSLPLERALHLSIGAILPLLVIVVYSTSRLFTTPRWSVFAAGLFAVVGYAIEWSIHLIPTSLGLAFFAGIVYLLCRLLYYRFDTAEFLLLLLLNIAVVLTHQIATFITLVMLASSVLVLVLFPKRLFPESAPRQGFDGTRIEATNLTGLFVFDLGFVTFMWSLTPFFGGSFLTTTIRFFQDTLTESEGFGDLAGFRETGDAPPLQPSDIELFVSYVDATVFLGLFLLACVGGLYVLHRDHRSYAPFTMGVSIIAMSIFVFGFPLFGIRSFVPPRWYAFMTVPMVILAALGTGHVLPKLNPTMVIIAFLFIVLLFPAASIISTSATIDSPAFDTVQTRYSYTESELAAVETVDTWFTSSTDESPLYTDHPYRTVFDRSEAHHADRLAFTTDGLATGETVVYREYQRGGTTYFTDSLGRTVPIAVTADVVCTSERSAVYDNGDVMICVT